MTISLRSRRRSFALFGSVGSLFKAVKSPAIAIAIFLAIWQLFSWLPGATLPGPIQVVQETWILILYPFYDRGGTDVGLFWQLLASLKRVAVGFTASAIVGIALGILIGVNTGVYKSLDPLFQLLRTIPPLAWLPLSLAALQKNEPAAIFVIFITSIWPILINTSVGVRQIPQDYNNVNVARVLQLSKRSLVGQSNGLYRDADSACRAKVEAIASLLISLLAPNSRPCQFRGFKQALLTLPSG